MPPIPQASLSAFGGSASDATALPDRMLKAIGVCEYFYDLHPRTIDRWIEDLGFPRPYYIKGTRFWRLSEIAEWFGRQPREDTAGEARRAALSEGRQKGQTKAARAKAAATRRRRKQPAGEDGQ